MVTVKPIAFSTLVGDEQWQRILAAYTDECELPNMPPCDYNEALYAGMEQSGLWHAIGVYVDDALVGFCGLMITVLPHFNKATATTESLFVLQEHRGTGAGLALLREVERYAREKGARGLFVSAQVQTRMDKIMPLLGYTHASNVYCKALP